MSRRREIRAAWMRVAEHTEALRRMAGALIDLVEGRSAEPEDLAERLALHGAGLRGAASDLEGIGREIVAAPSSPPITRSGLTRLVSELFGEHGTSMAAGEETWVTTARPLWVFAEQIGDGEAIDDPEEIITVLHALVLGRNVVSATLIDGAARLVAIGMIDPASLIDERTAEEVVIDVYLRAHLGKARWMLPIFFESNRPEGFFLLVGGPPWFDLELPEHLRALLRGGWLAPALGGSAAPFSTKELAS